MKAWKVGDTIRDLKSCKSGMKVEATFAYDGVTSKVEGALHVEKDGVYFYHNNWAWGSERGAKWGRKLFCMVSQKSPKALMKIPNKNCWAMKFLGWEWAEKAYVPPGLVRARKSLKRITKAEECQSGMVVDAFMPGNEAYDVVVSGVLEVGKNVVGKAFVWLCHDVQRYDVERYGVSNGSLHGKKYATVVMGGVLGDKLPSNNCAALFLLGYENPELKEIEARIAESKPMPVESKPVPTEYEWDGIKYSADHIGTYYVEQYRNELDRALQRVDGIRKNLKRWDVLFGKAKKEGGV